MYVKRLPAGSLLLFLVGKDGVFDFLDERAAFAFVQAANTFEFVIEGNRCAAIARGKGQQQGVAVVVAYYPRAGLAEVEADFGRLVVELGQVTHDFVTFLVGFDFGQLPGLGVFAVQSGKERAAARQGNEQAVEGEPQTEQNGCEEHEGENGAVHDFVHGDVQRDVGRVVVGGDGGHGVVAARGCLQFV